MLRIMWDIPGGGIPLAPLLAAMQSLGVPTNSPNPEISRIESLRALWQQAGLHDVDARVIRIPVVFPDFDDLWNSATLDTGPAGRVLRSQPPEVLEKVRARLRELAPAGADGRIVREAFVNAVKGARGCLVPRSRSRSLGRAPQGACPTGAGTTQRRAGQTRSGKL